MAKSIGFCCYSIFPHLQIVLFYLVLLLRYFTMMSNFFSFVIPRFTLACNNIVKAKEVLLNSTLLLMNSTWDVPKSLLESISPTFYARLFHTKVLWEAFLYLHFRLLHFWRKNISSYFGEIDTRSTQIVVAHWKICLRVNTFNYSLRSENQILYSHFLNSL